MFLVKCLPLVEAPKNIGFGDWEWTRCHLCSYCCGVNKSEPTSHFSLYLLTHSWVSLPVLSLHLWETVNSLREQEFQCNPLLTRSVSPIRESCSHCNRLIHFYDDAYISFQADMETGSSLYNLKKTKHSFR